MVGGAAMLATPGAPAWQLRGMVGWDAMALTLLGVCWSILYRSDARSTELRAGDEDPGGFAVFVIAVLSSLVSLFAATLVLRLMRGQRCESFWVVLALVSVALSWLVTHTAYTLRYAHLYYTGEQTGGLLFPGTERPCDLDFAYYAFTLGMCFQVSDVQVTAQDIRRTTLGHALVSFVFNTTIVALSLNVMFQLLSGGP
jgi:uncharacterized membrane protein